MHPLQGPPALPRTLRPQTPARSSAEGLLPHAPAQGPPRALHSPGMGLGSLGHLMVPRVTCPSWSLLCPSLPSSHSGPCPEGLFWASVLSRPVCLLNSCSFWKGSSSWEPSLTLCCLLGHAGPAHPQHGCAGPAGGTRCGTGVQRAQWEGCVACCWRAVRPSVPELAARPDVVLGFSRGVFLVALPAGGSVRQ